MQLLAYEWRTALGGFGPGAELSHLVSAQLAAPIERSDTRADAQALAGLLKHWEESLIKIGFLDPLAPKKLIPRLQQLFNRAQLTQEEVHILRGVAKHMGARASGKEIDS